MSSGSNKMRSAAVTHKSKGKDVIRSQANKMTSLVRSQDSQLKIKIPIQRCKKRDKRILYEFVDECRLPLELVFEILLRLPVKSLGRFKSVCKRWNTLISSHCFIQAHLKHNNHASHLIFLVQKNYYFSLICKDNSARFTSCPIDSFFEIEGNLTVLPDRIWVIDGTTNGLIWMKSSDQIVHILNPITKECRDIPLPKLHLNPRRHKLYNACGFGFFPLMQDYKLVRLSYDVVASHAYITEAHVHIFSLRDDHWREIDVPAFDTSIDRYAYFDQINHGVVLLNNAFYWVVPCNYIHIGGFVVLKFDVVKETLTSMVNLEAKDISGRYKWRDVKVSIGVIGDDNLCVCRMPVACPSFIDMWKLKTEEGEGDWELLFRIGLESQFPREFPVLLGFVRSGDIFWRVRNGDATTQVWHFNPNTDAPTYEIFMEADVFSVTNFAASLVSPYQLSG